MKKVIFLFAVVAAIGSAFTTRPLTDQTWFPLKATLPSLATYQTSGTTQGNYDILSSYNQVTPIHIEAATVNCPDATGSVCAARIPSFTGGSNASQLDQVDLDALTAAPTQIKYQD